MTDDPYQTRMGDKPVCQQCGEPLTLLRSQWDGIVAATRKDGNIGGDIESRCGHVWTWESSATPEGRVRFSAQPYYQSTSIERSEYFRDDFDLELAKVAQGSPDGPGRVAFMDVLERYRGRFKSALDLGCCIGTITRMVREKHGVPVTGVDFSEACIAYAQEIDADGDYRAMCVGDIDTLEPGRYDLIYSNGVMMHCGPRFFAEVCAKIVGLRPRLIIHQEVQGREMVWEHRTNTAYVLRAHDYVWAYRGLLGAGAKIEHITEPKVVARNSRVGRDTRSGAVYGCLAGVPCYLSMVVVEVMDGVQVGNGESAVGVVERMG